MSSASDGWYSTFLAGMSAGVAVASALVVFLKPDFQPQEKSMALMTFVVHHVKNTKTTIVYGPDPMDALSPLINTIYLQKSAMETQLAIGVPARLVVTIDIAGE